MYFFFGGKTTRDKDLAELEARRDESDDVRAANKRLDDVYRQSKNHDLEAARQKLIEAHRKGDVDRTYHIEREIKERWG